LAQLPGAPVRTLRDIVLSGKVVPSRARSLMSSLGRSSASPVYLEALLSREGTRQTILALMADERLDALVYATFDHQPARIAPDVMTKPVVADAAGLGNNRRLSPVLGFPALTIPAGFTAEGIPVGIEFLARPFAEGLLFKLGYAFEQGTHHRKPPRSTPALPGEP
ncbi:MAG: amidase family protein, partial [Vicinamibacterales bacterium]